MSDAAASGTAGPSIVTGSEIEQELEVAELNFQQGIQAIKVRSTKPTSSVRALEHFPFTSKYSLLVAKLVPQMAYTQANNLDQAVELFGQVLQGRCQLFGGIFRCCYASVGPGGPSSDLYTSYMTWNLQISTLSVPVHTSDMAQLCFIRLRTSRMSLALAYRQLRLKKKQM